MTRTYVSLFVLLAGVALLLPGALTAQNDAAVASSAKKADYRGPLPFYFGKLGIEDDQKLKLYAIDDDYASKIEALEKQIETLENERDAKMETLLTPGQKLRLKELREAAAKRAAAEAQSPAQQSTSTETAAE